jgi:hypothetical protein
MIFQKDFKVIIIEEHKLIYTVWLRAVSSTLFREAMLFAYKCIKEQGLELWLLDTPLHNPVVQDQNWSVEELGKLLQNTALKKVALVHNDDLLVELVAEIMRENSYKTYGRKQELENFCTVQEGLEFLLPEIDTTKILNQLKDNIGIRV